MSFESPVRTSRVVRIASRAVLLIALAGAVLVTAASAVAAIVSTAQEATSRTTSAALFSGAALPSGTVHGRLVEATWRQADVVVRDVPGGVVALAVAADVAGLVARFALGAALVLLLVAVLRRVPFRDRTAVQMTLAGGFAAIGSLLQIGLGGLRDLMLAQLLTSGGSGDWPATSVFDPTLLAVGFGVMVVGLLLAHGAELQQETEGLV